MRILVAVLLIALSIIIMINDSHSCSHTDSKVSKITKVLKNSNVVIQRKEKEDTRYIEAY